MLELINISKKFADFSLTDISFRVEKGDYFVVLGESGAGKSIILEIIAGLIKPDMGKIFLNEKEITGEKIQTRKTGLLFQDYAVFPHLSVKKNIAYGCHVKDKKQKNELIEYYADQVNIKHLLHRKPSTLSGGELQRLVLARTLITEPLCILLDEPLSSIDSKLKIELRSLLRKINKAGNTVIHVTHEYEEAISLANKVAIIENGCLIQQGALNEVFLNPVSEFVAGFAGIRNFYKAKVIRENTVIADGKTELKILSGNTEEEGTVMFRSEDVILSDQKLDSSLSNNLKAKIIDIYPSINGIEVVMDAGIIITSEITRQSFEKMKLVGGREIWAGIKASAIKFVK